MIRIIDLQKNFQKTKALNKVSITIPKGVITGLAGPNGCGKTTLIKSILGLVIPDSGEILIQEKTIKGECTYRQNIGYMPQNPDFPENLSIAELLNLIEDVRGTKAPLKQNLIELFGLKKIKSIVNLEFFPEVQNKKLLPF